MEEFNCPGCSAHLTERQLVTTSVVTDSCPRCRTLIRQRDGFHCENVDLRVTQDVSSIDNWLANECRQLGQTVESVREQEERGEYLWRITGNLLSECPDNWNLEVRHNTRAPDIALVRVMAAEPTLFSDREFDMLRRVFHDHGVQPHGARHQSCGISGSQQESQWGAQQYLSIGPMCDGLLRPVVVRLLDAMRDALTNRAHRNQQPGS
jgi:hypothetical protein